MKSADLEHIEVFVDGGCKGNGTAEAKCYGSFKVFAISKDGKTEEVKHCKFELPLCETNNQAEYESLGRALEYISSLVSRAGKFKVAFFTDSQLVAKQVAKEYKVKDEMLAALCDNVQLMLSMVNGTLSWVDNQVMKEILGH